MPLATQAAVLAGIALVMTVGVYGVVAGIVKLDDLGLWLSRRERRRARALGRGILASRAVADEAAVDRRHGGDVPGRRRHPVHGLPWLHHAVQGWAEGRGPLAAALLPTLADGLAGIVAGALVLAG